MTMTENIKSICTYLGSSNSCDDLYKQTAINFGKLMGAEGLHLVYGGGNVGLMGLLANSVLEHGGTVTGIIPSHISDKEVSHDHLTELHVVDSMHVRKQMMVDKADAFAILPGGIGTLDELCEIMTWRQLGIHDMPIVVCNINGYWTPFLEMIDHIIASKFMREGDKNILVVVDKVEDIIPALKNAPGESFDPSSKWI